MAYIYCIVNNVNGKKYIGKTTNTIETRFRQHIFDSRKSECKNRTLYKAFEKYGIENFSIHQLEECDWDKASEREIYYISLYDTFRNGYNETLGGDGGTKINYNEALRIYFEYCNIPLVAEKIGIHPSTLRNILTGMGLKPITYYKSSNPVICLDMNNKKQYIFKINIIK